MKEYIVRIDTLFGHEWFRGVHKDGRQTHKFWVLNEAQYESANEAHMAGHSGWVKVVVDKANYVQSIERVET